MKRAGKSGKSECWLENDGNSACNIGTDTFSCCGFCCPASNNLQTPTAREHVVASNASQISSENMIAGDDIHPDICLPRKGLSAEMGGRKELGAA